MFKKIAILLALSMSSNALLASGYEMGPLTLDISKNTVEFELPDKSPLCGQIRKYGIILQGGNMDVKKSAFSLLLAAKLSKTPVNVSVHTVCFQHLLPSGAPEITNITLY